MKHKHTIGTLDGPISWEDEKPPTIRKTPEEIEEERVRLYPTEEIASYLLYLVATALINIIRYILIEVRI
jgi:hypothetical protein